jgi:hypothetical protein
MIVQARKERRERGEAYGQGEKSVREIEAG